MTNKEKYREFCKKEPNIPIFSKDWWLDAVCGEENWDVCIVEKGGEVWATMPYYIQKKLGFTFLTMPKLTQTLGPYIRYPENQKYYSKLSWEKEMMTILIEQLPKIDYFKQNFNYKITNWLPFYWKGFEQTTRYTYIIPKSFTLDLIEKEYETDVRRRRRKAEKFGVKLLETNNIENFYYINKLTFERKGYQIPYTFELVKKIYDTCSVKNAVKIVDAVYQNKIISSAFFIEDSESVYYLMGGIVPEFKDIGGMEAIIHYGIAYAISNKKNFDFEGSMVESIEKFFRSFGAIQRPYFSIFKINSKVLKIYKTIKDLLKED
ncbi:MAG: FemAB family protein [Candidatus Aenigmatarchaeota archaeon]